jgi:hypothetical protein
MAAKSHIYEGADYPQRIAALNRQMVQALHAAGAGVLLGTDAAQPYHIPGFSIHEELAALVDAGLSPYEAIAAGTRLAADAMGRSDEFGTIAKGKRADMILVQEDPLANVSHVQSRTGVMVRGQWLPETRLQSMLGGLVEFYQPTLFERLWPLAVVGTAFALVLRQARQSRKHSRP